MTRTILLAKDSTKASKETWEELVKSMQLELEVLEWQALPNKSLNASIILFSLSEWKELGDSDKKKLRPLLEESFKLVELNSSDYQEGKAEFSCNDERTFLVDFKAPIDFWKPGVMGFLKLQKLQESKELMEIGEGLNQLVTQSLQELQRVKKIHEALVPLRKDQIKGLSIMSKFAAGESAGGEFYDVVQGEDEFVVILSHSSSYMASSFALSAFEELREKRSFGLDRIQAFSLGLGQQIKEKLGVRDAESFQLFMARVDMKSLVIEGVNWGHSQLLSSGAFFVGENDLPIDSSFVEKATFQNKLARNEKYVLLSPGLRENCHDLIEGEQLLSFTRRLMSDGPKKMLQEIFYQLKKTRESSFLKYDATSVFIEVGSNVIVQI